MSKGVGRVWRAPALPAVAGGAAFSQVAQAAGFRSHTRVAKLVVRFNQRGLAALNVARPGVG